jgi:teichuronic acid biosynthesis glycosyltransferase TuaG
MFQVSIIMPYFKKKKFIENSIRCILNQSYQNFQIIIVDDELSLESSEVLKRIHSLDKRIKVINNPQNLGAGQSRNSGIEVASGDLIAFCDCDDLWKETKLEKQINFMRETQSDLSFTAYEIIDEDGLIIGSRKAKNILIFNDLIKSCDIGLSTVILKKELFNNLDYKFAHLKTKEDYVLWLKMVQDGKMFRGLNEYLSSWRKSKNSLSSSIFQKLTDGFQVYRVYLKYNIFKSLICLFVLSVNSILR